MLLLFTSYYSLLNVTHFWCIDNCAIGLGLDATPLCIELHYRIPVIMLLEHIVGIIVRMSRQQWPLEALVFGMLPAVGKLPSQVKPTSIVLIL